jgi:hypothetical protein
MNNPDVITLYLSYYSKLKIISLFLRLMKMRVIDYNNNSKLNSINLVSTKSSSNFKSTFSSSLTSKFNSNFHSSTSYNFKK